VATWFVPAQIMLHRIVRGLLAFMIAVIGPGYVFWQQIRDKKLNPDTDTIPLWIIIIYVPSYIALLAVNSFLLDAGTTIEGAIRYLVPLLTVVIILEVSCYYRLLKALNFRRMAVGSALLYAAFVLVLSGVTMVRLASKSTLIFGFTGIRSTLSPVAEILEGQNPSIPIISTNPERVYYLIGRPAYMKPIEFDVYQQSLREDFEEQIELATERLKNGSYFVFFDKPSAEEERILSLLPIEELFAMRNVVIYAYKEP
jgi:hypothetical protein